MFRVYVFFLLAISVSQHLLGGDAGTLQVTGSSMQSVPSDKASLSVGVVTQDQNAEKAMNQNQMKMNQVMQALQKLGLGKGEVQTLGFDLSPQYSPRPKNAPSDWRPTIVGYEVKNKLQIETENLDLLGRIISSASSAGANQIDSISFGLKNTMEIQQQAIQGAVDQAKGYAEAAARQAGVKIKKIHSIAVNPSSIAPRFMKSERFALASAPITPGDVEVQATVTIEYEID